ncbi:hypothetical protein BJY04DRAFT_210726 [Aspergillus karnatakaensis]|uniref:uncharacterized protein n=1 Tax=Aspergillus karnatakaensis TaxID=1810916 RepID=UPI003CCCA8E8
MDIKFVLVTGATGFIGAHIVDALLARGLRVRGATRSPAKAQAMLNARPQYKSQLEFVQINDFESPGGLEEAVSGVDGVIHAASPFTYNTTDNERELIIPAINGVKALFAAAHGQSPVTVKRIVLTSSFASVLDTTRKTPPYFTYTSSDWNPQSYAHSIDPSTSAVVAYRGSKKFAELAAWEFISTHKPDFDLVSLCPPMTFGPVVHPVAGLEGLNESNAMLWQAASGRSCRDLAGAHVEALLRGEVGGGRYTVCAPERFSYGVVAGIVKEEFEGLRGGVRGGGEEQGVDESYGLDGERAGRELGVQYRRFRETVVDFVRQGLEMR